METAIVSGIIKEVITSLGTFAYNEIVKVLGVKDEIEKLDESLARITDEIRTADQTIAHSEATNEQLKKLTDIAYEAESIIDRFTIEMNIRTSQLQVTNHTTESHENCFRRMMLKFQEWSGSSVCRPCREVGTRYQAANDIERLNKRLEDMQAQRNLIQVLQALAARHQARPSSSQIGPSHDVAGLIGSIITNNCNNFVRSLRRNGGNGEALFAIVGAPGVGKTALAQKIYHEMRDESRIRMWVHVPGGAGDRLTIWLGEQMDNEAASAQTLEQQKYIIHRRLNGSRLLLVVDNVRDEDGWKFLGTQKQDFLDRGVKVLVTTPSRDIARRIGINVRSCCHHVSPLDKDEGWLLLCRAAHLNERTAVGNIQDAGRRIVHQCSGLPLALKAVGSNLRSRNRVDHWERELDTNFIVKYKEVRRSIDASYMDLGYRLKRCFLYCALYPEGYAIEQRHIVQQWIAEGFFQGMESTGNRRPPEPEEEARKCYKELVKRSLLLPTENGADRGATMPALLRSYAIYRSQDENCTGDPTPIGRAFKAWRLSVADASAVHNIPDDVTSLRTFMVLGTRIDTASTTPSSLMDVICRKFTGLRVLDLRNTQVEAVSSNLERLVQLRYLNLSNTSITTLPPEVGNLVVLQFLILKDCCHLTSLPEEIGRLKNLRSLDISGTEALRDVHFRLNNLTGVNCFRGFLPVGSASAGLQGSNNHGWTFSELGHLSKLTSLQILKLGRSISRHEVSQLRLHDKTHLKELELWCTPVDWRSDVGDAEDDPQGLSTGGGFLDVLDPPQYVATLKLAQFPGSELPNWVSPSHLTQLQRLTLDGCYNCRRLPPLGEMSHLKFLAFTGPNAMLSELGNELRGAPREGVAFPRLEQLIVARMENLETWWGLEPRDMPLLRSFQLSRCRKLNELPAWLQDCTALTSLKVQHAKEILEIDNLLALKELEVGICCKLRRISNLVRLQDLKIKGCSNLRAVQSLPLLRYLRLDEHGEQLPQWLLEQHQLLPLPLRRLEIVGSEGLLHKCSTALPPYGPFIQDAADHVYTEHNGSVYSSYTKSTRCFLLSQQCMQRAHMYGPVAMRVDPQMIQGNREPWMRRWLYTLCAAVLIAIQVFLLYIFFFLIHIDRERAGKAAVA